MNRILYESHFLINIAASIVRQEDMRPLHGKFDWERMFRISDYHRISNLIYPGVLGNEKVPENWRERFFERYQESLQFSDICEKEEREILALLDVKEVPTLLLESCKRRELYQMKELAGECVLRLHLKPEDYSFAKGFLIDLGYETDRIYANCGERMRKSEGFCVEIYDRIPYKTAAFHKQIKKLFNDAHLISGFDYIYELTETERLTYLLARISYCYVTGKVLIRQLLDLCLLHRSLREENLEDMWRWLEKLKIATLSEKLLNMSYMWFGTKEERVEFKAQDELELYDLIENRILGYGREHEEKIPEELALATMILKEEERENYKMRRKLFLQKILELKNQLCDLFREYIWNKEK